MNAQITAHGDDIRERLSLLKLRISGKKAAATTLFQGSGANNQSRSSMFKASLETLRRALFRQQYSNDGDTDKY